MDADAQHCTGNNHKPPSTKNSQQEFYRKGYTSRLLDTRGRAIRHHPDFHTKRHQESRVCSRDTNQRQVQRKAESTGKIHHPLFIRRKDDRHPQLLRDRSQACGRLGYPAHCRIGRNAERSGSSGTEASGES